MGYETNETTCLFADPSFWGGFASALDLGGTLSVYNTSRNEVEADLKALACDWSMVGRDIYVSIEQFEKESK